MTTPDLPGILISIRCTPHRSRPVGGLLHIRQVSSSEIVRTHSHWDQGEIWINLSNSHAGARGRIRKERDMPYAQSRQYSILKEQRVPDGVLVGQALEGDQCAFEFLVNRYHQPLVGYIRGFLKDNDQIYDVLQHVYLQLYLSLPPKIRSIVHLRCFKQLSFAEIGRTLNMPEMTVKTTFYRSLPRLRRALASSVQFASLS